MVKPFRDEGDLTRHRRYNHPDRFRSQDSLSFFERARWHIRSWQAEITQPGEESSHDRSYTIPVDPGEPGSVSAYLEHLIDENRKSTPLKSIQGIIWKEGYESGELTSIVFDDVPRAFERWKAAGKTIAIFSSG